MILRRLFRPINIRRTFSRIHSRSISFQIVDCNLTEHSVKADEGDTLLEICEKHSIEVEAACGGECCCSTCHCFLSDELFEAIEEPDEDELDMLDLAIGVQETSRLACQVKITPGFESTIVRLATETSNQLSWIVLHSTPRTKLCSNGNFSTCRNFSMKTCSTYLFEDKFLTFSLFVLFSSSSSAFLHAFFLSPLLSQRNPSASVFVGLAFHLDILETDVCVLLVGWLFQSGPCRLDIHIGVGLSASWFWGASTEPFPHRLAWMRTYSRRC